MATQQVRVLIAQENSRFTERLAEALNRQPDLDIVATAATMVEAVTRTVDLHPDVLLLDRGLPGAADVDLGAVIGYLRPDTRVVYVGHDHREIVDVVRGVGQCAASAITPSYGK